MMKKSLLLCCVAWLCATIAAQADSRPQTSDERVILHTTKGDLTIRLDAASAPEHANRFLKLARAGVYDSTFFYRVDRGFMAQVSDAGFRLHPLSGEQQQLITPIPEESNAVPHRRGSLSMARQNESANNAQTSFISLFADAPHLNGSHTVFGRVEYGEEVLEAIRQVRVDSDQKPIENIILEKAEIVSAFHASAQKEKQEQPLRLTSIGLAAMLLFMGLALSETNRRTPTPLLTCATLVSVLGGLMALLIATGDGYREYSPAVGTALLAAMAGVFGLLSRFESPR